MDIVTVVIGVIVGAGLTYTLLYGRTRKLQQRNQALEGDTETLQTRLAGLESQAAAAEATLKAEREAHGAYKDDVTSRLDAHAAGKEELRADLGKALQRAHQAEAALLSEQSAHEARLEELRTLGKEVETKFGELSARALERSGENFLQLVTERFEQHKEAAERDLGARQKEIRTVVEPLDETLREFRNRVDALEKDRAESQGRLDEQVRGLRDGQKTLSTETGRLVQALRRPEIRGQWGELQLRNALEMAGLVRNHDFEEQPTLKDGKRPDVILRLPGGRAIVVDAKTPLEGYLDAVEAKTRGSRRDANEAHARHVRAHVERLARKEYWEQVPDSVDFVVMFLPNEALFARAIEQDPELFDYAASQRVVISTPTTFIALAKAIAYGWKQEQIADESRKIADLGRKLFKRLSTFAGHLQKTGKALRQTVEHYNRSVGSFESRLLPKAREFEGRQFVPTEKKIPALERVSAPIRPLITPESETAAAATTPAKQTRSGLLGVSASSATATASDEPTEV